MAVRGVIFDCDGTLLDSMDAWLATQDEIAYQAGVTLSGEDIATICTLTIPETGDFFHDRFGLGDSGNAVVAMINEAMLANYQTKVRARPGALDFVRELFERGITCSVASSTPSALLQAGLNATGFLPYLEAVVSVDDAGASKRSPAVYDLALQCMGTEKAHTWVFEDAAYALRTLKDAGYHSIGIYDDDIAGTLEELAIADLVIKDYADIDIALFVSDPLACV